MRSGENGVALPSRNRRVSDRAELGQGNWVYTGRPRDATVARHVGRSRSYSAASRAAQSRTSKARQIRLRRASPSEHRPHKGPVDGTAVLSPATPAPLPPLLPPPAQCAQPACHGIALPSHRRLARRASLHRLPAAPVRLQYPRPSSITFRVALGPPRIPIAVWGLRFSSTGFIRHARRTTDKGLFDIEISRQETLLSSATSYGAGGTLRRDRLCLWSKGLPVAETE
jgi:hypothetical protein